MPLSNQSLCLTPTVCGSAPGTTLVMASCNLCQRTPGANTFMFDFYTYFTFTNTASALLITDNGSGAVATIESGSNAPNQQYMFNPTTQTIQPAIDSTLCLTSGV